MKITIEHSRTKRQIVGAFNICGSREDLVSLAEQILDEARGERAWTYGWINILPSKKRQPSICDTAPTGWDDNSVPTIRLDGRSI